MAAEKNTVGLHGGDSAGGINGSIALHQDHSSHVAGDEMAVFRAWRGRAALRGDEAVALDLRRELLQRGGLKAGEDKRSFDGRKSGACRERKRRNGSLYGGSVKRQRKLLRAALRRRANDVFDGRYARDGIFGEDAEFEGERAREFAIQIDGAAAHARDDASALDLGAFELNEDDRLARPKEIGHHPDDFEIELFNLVAGEDRVRVALHPGSNLVERKNLIRLREGGDRKDCDGQGETEGPEDSCAQMERGWRHELLMILGAGTGGNWTHGGKEMGRRA